MLDFPNSFQLIGKLSEYKFEFNGDTIISTLAIQCGYDVINIKFYISESFNKLQYNELMNLYYNAKDDVYIFTTGNIIEHKDRLYFNGKFARIVNPQDEYILININGICIGDNKILNISNGLPTIFNIDYDMPISNDIFQFDLIYNPKFILNDNIVASSLVNRLSINKFSETEYYLDDEDLENLMMQIEILNMK